MRILSPHEKIAEQTRPLHLSGSRTLGEKTKPKRQTEMKAPLNTELAAIADRYLDNAKTNELARLLGTSPLTIREIVKQRRKATPEQIDAIQKAVVEIHKTHTKYLQSCL